MSDDTILTSAELAEADILPRLHEVHTGAPHTVPELPAAVAKCPPSQKSPAQWAYERIIIYIKKFEETLDNDQEVAMGFTGSSAGVLRIEGLGYFDPDIVTFYGSDGEGGRTQLIQHVSQLNVVLRALPKPMEEPEPKRIGFQLAQSLEKDPATGA